MWGINIGEIFMNSVMQNILRNACGVDVTHILFEDPKLAYWESQIWSEWEI